MPKRTWRIEVEEDNGETFVRIYDGTLVTIFHLYEEDARDLYRKFMGVLESIMGEPE